MTKIVAISDTHMRHRDLEVPEGDILIHAGSVEMFRNHCLMVSSMSMIFQLQPHRSNFDKFDAFYNLAPQKREYWAKFVAVHIKRFP